MCTKNSCFTTRELTNTLESMTKTNTSQQPSSIPKKVISNNRKQ